MQARKATSSSVMQAGRAVPKITMAAPTNEPEIYMVGLLHCTRSKFIRNHHGCRLTHLEFMQIESKMLGSYVHMPKGMPVPRFSGTKNKR